MPTFVIALITGVIGVFLDMMIFPEPVEEDPKIPKKIDAPPTPPPVKNPPKKDPPCEIKPPPEEIFRDPPINQDPPPEPPKRVLPPVVVSTDTETTFTSPVKQGLFDHKFGCLLARPFYSADVNLCIYDNRPISDFNATLTSDMVTDVESITDEDLGTGLALRTATALVSLDALSPSTLVMGVKHMNKLANYYSRMAYSAGSYEVTGLISTGALNITDCSVPEVDYEYPKLEASFDGAECSIPVTMFDELEGYKADQLQIIWRNTEWATNPKRKYFTLPSPIDATALDSALDGLFSSFTFGNTLIEIWLKIADVPEAIRPIQKCQIYTDFKTKDECKAFVEGQFTEWLNAVTTGVTIKEFYPTFFDDAHYYVGSCTAHRAVLMGWDVDKKHWCKKADWLLKKTPTP